MIKKIAIAVNNKEIIRSLVRFIPIENNFYLKAIAFKINHIYHYRDRKF
ncbi:hypothetical protein [Hyella patelloides]|nr:hypothetical protein [Hyella patelloides]